MTIEDLAYEAQQLAMHDTIAWDAIYAQATAQSRKTGFAQIILKLGPADYDLVDGTDPTALRVERLKGAKVHVVLDWTRAALRLRQSGLPVTAIRAARA